MSESFGPWATAVATGANPQLNTFWKRRLAMLSSLKESGSRITRRAVLVLVCLAIGALTIPTLKWAADGPRQGLSKPGRDGSLVLLAEAGANDQSAESSKSAQGEPGPDDEYFPRPTKAERKILDALEKTVEVDFQELGLEDCITSLQEQANIDIWLDREKLTDEGVALDQPITLKLKGRRLESILNLVLRPKQLEYLIDDDVLKITTAPSAGDTLFTRTYPVGDILMETPYPWAWGMGGRGGGFGGGMGGMGAGMIVGAGNSGGNVSQKEDVPAKGSETPPNNAGGTGPANNGASRGGTATSSIGPATPQQSTRKGPDFNSLMNTIETTVVPDSWEALSGPGSMMPTRVSNSLVVRQTWAVHRNVLQLLRDLRSSKRERREAARWPTEEPQARPAAE